MITKARQAEEIIAEGKADIVALARGMMFDPRWAWHATEELGVDTEYSRMHAHCTRAMACGISVARHLNRVSCETGGVEFLVDQISSCICLPCKMPAQ